MNVPTVIMSPSTVLQIHTYHMNDFRSFHIIPFLFYFIFLIRMKSTHLQSKGLIEED